MSITIQVPGIAQPAGSKKGFHRGGHVVIVDANDKARPWKDRVIAEARSVIGRAAPLDGPLRLTVTFGLPRPAGHYGKKGLRASARAYPTVKPDATKLIRCTEDALTEAGVWRDDAQVVEQLVRKVYTEQPGTTIHVGSISEPAQP